MTTTDTEKVEINTTVTANQRLTTILLILLIILLTLLVLGIVASFVMMGWGMMNGGMMNDMHTACLDMMSNIQTPQ